MNKNEIIKTVIDSLMKQRYILNDELACVNHNEASFKDRKITLEMAINNIDTQVQNNVMALEVNLSKTE